MDVYCRWPGSVHDAKIFEKSTINQELRDDELPVTYQQLKTGRCNVGCYYFDGSAYPLRWSYTKIVYFFAVHKNRSKCA